MNNPHHTKRKRKNRPGQGRPKEVERVRVNVMLQPAALAALDKRATPTENSRGKVIEKLLEGTK